MKYLSLTMLGTAAGVGKIRELEVPGAWLSGVVSRVYEGRAVAQDCIYFLYVPLP